MLVPTLLATAVPAFGTFGRDNHPPQPFDESVTLPGKAPATIEKLRGAWHFSYADDNAELESGSERLMVTIILWLHEDGSYDLTYNARWGDGGIAAYSKGIGVRENGSFSLSGDVLLLEPQATHRSELDHNAVVHQLALTNENHVLLAHVEKKRLHVAGRCAKYQVDPACRQSANVWYSLESQLGRR